MSRSNAMRNQQTRKTSIGTLRALSKGMTRTQKNAARRSHAAQVAEIQAMLRGDIEAAKAARRDASFYAELAQPFQPMESDLRGDEW